VCVRERERYRDRQRETDRQTERQRERETETEMERVKHYYDFNHTLVMLDQVDDPCAPVPLHNNSSNSFRQSVTRKQFNLHTI